MFKTSLIYFLIRAINGVLGLASIYALTRLLSAEQYGLYTLGIAGASLCGSILFQWIAVAVARLYAGHVAAPDALLTEAYRLFVRVAAACLLVTLVYFLWSPISSIEPQLILAIGIGAIATGLHSLGLQVANARGQPIKYGYLTASRAGLALVASVALVQAGFSGIGAVFGVQIACIISATLFGARRLTKVKYNNPKLRHHMLAYGLPLTLTYFATMILDVSDRFLIGWWLGMPAVAGYAASYDLTQQTVGALINVLFLASYPRVTAAWEAGGVTAARKAMLPLSQAMQFGVPLMAGIFVGLAPQICQLVIGASIQEDAAQVMPWIAIAVALGCFKSFFLDIAFQLKKVTHMQLRITAIMAAINILLNIIFLPKFGIIGSAISTTTAYAIGTNLSWRHGQKIDIYPIKQQQLISMLLAFIFMVLASKFSPTSSSNLIIDLLIRLTSGLTGFFSIAIITNLSGIRTALIKWIHRNKNDFEE